ncbi:MAG: COX15/CtaA family protein [Cryobacterium sp.]|nr:COX15/CtaA family protein [Oligoflexia bacterium]
MFTLENDDLKNNVPAVRLWLLSICIVITLMVSIGGITRLTGSGLSITDWAPIMGAIPPLDSEGWNLAFAKYQNIPQFKLVNSSISLAEFKTLYFWEWFHRLVGRLIGFVVLIPGVILFARKKITKRLAARVAIGFLFGGAQGALGWFMVKSGLSERTSVSHFRLAAHLSLALSILAYFVWLTRSVFVGQTQVKSDQEIAARFLRGKFPWVASLFGLQITYGAFVAGMKAGKAFNTFPLMAGSVIPSNFLSFEPAWLNFVENPATVQWIHRSLGWAAFIVANGLWIWILKLKTPRGEVRRIVTLLAHLTIFQFLVGVLTLVYAVPVALGVLHQFGAALIVMVLTLMAHTLKRFNASHTP